MASQVVYTEPIYPRRVEDVIYTRVPLGWWETREEEGGAAPSKDRVGVGEVGMGCTAIYQVGDLRERRMDGESPEGDLVLG